MRLPSSAFTYEELLQLLIAVVDAELFEAVPPEDLEAVDVEDPDDGGIGHVGLRGGRVNRRVHLGHDPGEQPVIQRLNIKLLFSKHYSM